VREGERDKKLCSHICIYRGEGERARARVRVRERKRERKKVALCDSKYL